MKTGQIVGTMTPDGLIVDGRHDLDVMGATVTVPAGTTIKRGAPLAFDENEKLIQLTASQLNSSSLSKDQMPTVINCDDIVNLGASSLDVYTSVYKSGNFSQDFVEDVIGASMRLSIKERFREVGIYFEKVLA